MTSKVEPFFDEIVALVAGGMSVPVVLKLRPEYPILATWKSYAYDNRFPDRRHRLEAAQAQGSSEGRSARYAEEIVSLVEGGMTIGEALSSNPKYPHRSKFRLYVLKHPELDDRINRAQPKRSKMTPAFDKVVRDVSLGKPVVKALACLPDQLSETCLRRFVQNNPEQARRLRLARFAASRVVRKSKQPAAKPAVEYRHRGALRANELYRRVSKLVPTKFDPDRREDIISDCILAVLSGKAADTDIAGEIKLRNKYYWETEDRCRNQSLDQNVYSDDDEMLLIDALRTDDVAHWGY